MRIILLILLFCSCTKQVKQPAKANEVKYCNDFAGTWICLNDTSIKDSLVVSGFALRNAQFKGQMLVAKLAQIPCYLLMRLIRIKLKLEHETKTF